MNPPRHDFFLAPTTTAATAATGAPYAKEVEIQQATSDPKRKTRAFGATLVGLLRASPAWDTTVSDTDRPVMAVFAVSEMEAAPFEANLREGHGCVSLGSNGKVESRYEFHATAGYAWHRQRTSEGVLLTAYLPEVFAHDPGFIEEWGARFVAMPSTEWSEAQRELIGARAIGEAIDHCDDLGLLKTTFTDPDLVRQADVALRRMLAEMAPTAALTMSMLDRRIRAPIIADFRFQLQVFLALHRAKVVSGAPLAMSDLTGYFHESKALHLGLVQVGLAAKGNQPGLGYERAVAVGVRHDHVEKVLAFEVKRYREGLVAREAEARARSAARPVKRPNARRKVA